MDDKANNPGVAGWEYNCKNDGIDFMAYLCRLWIFVVRNPSRIDVVETKYD